MVEQMLLVRKDTEKVVNIASVKKLSPFRYPGGKTWLVPHITKWVKELKVVSKFVEPFAGGGIVSLSIADQSLAEEIVMIEKDEAIASVWKTIFSGESDKLVDLILSFNFDINNVSNILSSKPCSELEFAFQTIIKNRAYHGGIMANGASMIKNGENGKGIASRWYPETISNRIRTISKLKNIRFIQGDAFDFIHSFDKRSLLFVDPPYTAGGKKAGKRLYNYHSIDHELLFAQLRNTKSLFLMTYDDSDEVRELAINNGFSFKTIPMKGTHHNVMHELIIYRL